MFRATKHCESNNLARLYNVTLFAYKLRAGFSSADGGWTSERSRGSFMKLETCLTGNPKPRTLKPIKKPVNNKPDMHPSPALRMSLYNPSPTSNLLKDHRVPHFWTTELLASYQLVVTRMIIKCCALHIKFLAHQLQRGHLSGKGDKLVVRVVL